MESRINAAMELMGHRDPKMTARYTHLSVEYKRQAVASLPQFGKAVLEGELRQNMEENPPQTVVAFAR